MAKFKTGDTVKYTGDDLHDDYRGIVRGAIGIIVEVDDSRVLKDVCYVKFEGKREVYPNRFPGRMFDWIYQYPIPSIDLELDNNS